MKNLNKYTWKRTFTEKLSIWIILSVLLFATSCDVLDIQPTDRFSETVVWNDPAFIEPYIAHTYRVIPAGLISPLYNLSAATNDVYSRNSFMQAVQVGNITPANLKYVDYWTSTLGSNRYINKNYWYPIKKVNVFMEKFNRENLASTEPATLNRMEGEMRTIRAFCYFKLINIFNGVPLITKPFSIDDDFNIPRNSYDEVMQFVLEELDKAIPLLPEEKYSSSLQGHLTKGAAMALKSRALLYYASPKYNPNNDRARWQAAADAAEDVMKMGYSLFPDYRTMFLEENIYNSEMIWQRPYNHENWTTINYAFVELSLYPNGYKGYCHVTPLQNLVDAYETVRGILPKDDPDYDPQNPYIERDPRFYETVLYDGRFWKGREVETFLPGGKDTNEGTVSPWNATRTGYYLWKFADTTVVNPGKTGDRAGDTPWPWIRYSEVLLNYAEANYFLGKEDLARDYVNMIRQRPSVNMPDITESGEALFERIKHERRIELVFELNRWFDIRRWDILLDVMNKPLQKMSITKNEDGTKTYKVETITVPNMTEKDYYLPIPQSEIDKNPSLEQNPGYN